MKADREISKTCMMMEEKTGSEPAHLGTVPIPDYD